MSSVEEEASLSEAIRTRLEEFGYLSNVRAQLKVCALRKAQEMDLVSKRELTEEQMKNVLMCEEVLKYYGLENSAAMLRVESELSESEQSSDETPAILKKLRESKE